MRMSHDGDEPHEFDPGDESTIDANDPAAIDADPDHVRQFSLSSLLLLLAIVGFYFGLMHSGTNAFGGILFVFSAALAVLVPIVAIGRWINRQQAAGEEDGEGESVSGTEKEGSDGDDW